LLATIYNSAGLMAKHFSGEIFEDTEMEERRAVFTGDVHPIIPGRDMMPRYSAPEARL